ncbi:MAG: tRNA lysidine(34) synthetase TilS [Planctomycetes bacterium]|nr:tRNA lysidine(34) synthetase TilS [Planctomycetota bacterium]
MPDTLEDKLLHHFASNGLFEGIDQVLLAVSGGADSVAMVHVLAGFKKHRRLSCEFVIGHINHCLRGDESDADEALVKQLEQLLNIPVVSQRVDVKAYAAEHKLSIETAGRVLRLTTLAQMAEQNNCDCIVTAHHKDDLAETMVHRLMRGTGFRGLCGIWPVSEVYGAEFIRPMLGLRRAEIIQYCKDNSIQWRQDASNENVAFTRNHIRHHLLPALKNSVVGTVHPTGLDESGDIVDKLGRLSLVSQGFQSATERIVRAVITEGEFDQGKGQFTIKQAVLKETPAWVFYEVAREVLVKLGVGLRRYKREHFEMIQRLIGKKRSSLVLPNGVVVWALGDRLKFLYYGNKMPRKPIMLDETVIQLEMGQTVCFGPWRISSQMLENSKVDLEEFRKTKDPGVEWFDAERISGPVEIRGRRDGDRFWPIGASGEKKVGRFLIDAQLEAEAKQQTVVIKDTEKILWVAPIRMCEQAKIALQTQYILEIQLFALKKHN